MKHPRMAARAKARVYNRYLIASLWSHLIQRWCNASEKKSTIQFIYIYIYSLIQVPMEITSCKNRVRS